MNNPEALDEVLADLSASGVRLWYEGDRLRFQAPKGALDSGQRALLGTQRTRLIARMRDLDGARTEDMPVSDPQFMMWFQHQQSPASAFCTIGWALDVAGPLNMAAIRHAVQALVDRHAVLRTTYHFLEQGLVQRILGAARLSLDVLPLPQSMPLDREAILSEQLAAQIAQPFDLETELPMRMVLFTDGALEHLLLATFHHIAADARSTDTLRHELLTLYTEFVGEQPPQLARPTVSYADFVHWQAQEISGESGERQSAYWRRVLAAPRQASTFPAQLATPGAPQFAGASLRFALDSVLVTGVRDLAARLRITPFVVLLGAFQLLVARLCGIRDVITGTPALGRPTSDYHSVIGNFINVLPVRGRIEQNEVVAEFLTRLHGTVVNALEQQYYPLSRIVQDVRAARENSGQALFNTSFTMLKSDGSELPRGEPVPHTLFTWHPLTFQAGMLDMTLDVFSSASGMNCELKYALGALSVDAAGNLAKEYVRLLGTMTTAPDQTADALLDDVGGHLPGGVRGTKLPERHPVAAAGLLATLRSLGAQLAVVGDRLQVNAPAESLTPELRARIAAHKAELIALLRDSCGAASTDDAPLVPIARGGKLSLSTRQQQLWLVEQLRGEGTSPFNRVTVWPMAGRDLELLKQSIADVVRRQEIVRSAIRFDEMQPYVHVLPPEWVSIEVADLRVLSSAEQQSRLDSDLRAAIDRPFDFASEAPLRWTIYLTAGGELLLRVCASRVAMDERSFWLLRNELESSRDAIIRGIRRLPPDLQYIDYAAWERQRQAGPAVAAQLEWWHRRLGDLPDFCALPPDRRGRTDATGECSVAWDQEFTAKVRDLGLAHGATLFMVVLAGLAIRLRAATGRGDIVIGTSLGMRQRPELEAMIGEFANTVVLRLDLGDDPSFGELLYRTRATVLEAHDHREVSLETLVSRLNTAKALDPRPLFQVSATMHDALLERPARVYGGEAAQNMVWHMRETEEGLAMIVEYRIDLYLAETIEQMTSQVEVLLRAAIDDPSRPVNSLPLMTAQERRQVTVGFNATRVTLEPDPMVAQFEQQVERTPGSAAVQCEGSAASYDALNRRANQIARHLCRYGAGPGTRVGLCLDRSIDLLAVLLAVAKTGAAYVPLDPGFPALRLRYMIEDSAPTLLVVDTDRRLGAPASARIIDLTADALAIGSLQDTNLDVAPEGSHPAYIIYTSGSTGRPNGVVVSHSALANFLGSMRREPGLLQSDVFAAVTTVSFDIAALELYLPLLVGACTLMVPRAVAIDGGTLATLLSVERATVMQATPATWRLLLEAGWSGAPGFVALCGGDTLTPDLAQSLSSRVGALWNLYGPTETTVWSTLGRVEPDSDHVTIGRPIVNTQVYIRNAEGAPTPVGVPGEIWIGGAGVAIGYWGNPELTGQRFIPDPFVGEGRGGMLYRSGDLGRWLSDGRIVHMGRIDQQLKLRGFRIEPAEIEGALAAHPAIREAVVSVRGDVPERERLVAYVVYRSESAPTTSELRDYLRTMLPDYMIPAFFMAIDSVPRTPNGKLDRRGLPDVIQSSGAVSSRAVAPATPSEQVIARIWMEALAVERVGAHDNFFDLGGHSLLGLHVAAKIHKRTGWRMPSHVMFQQTLRQVAASLDDYRSARGSAE